MDASVVAALKNYIPQLLPEGILVIAACVLFLGSTFKASRNLWGWVAVLALLLAGAALARTWVSIPTVDATEARLLALSGALDKPENLTEYTRLKSELGASIYVSPVIHTDLGLWIKVIALAGGLLLVWLSWDEVPKKYTAEYHACLLLITAGVGITATANELVTLFLAMELISIPTYVLLYLPRADAPAQEAAMKYFLLSIFSAALMLFGFSYLYGLAGTTNITGIVDWMTRNTSPSTPAGKIGILGLPMIGMLLVIAGLGFKVTAVPFHFYAPDVYQGTPTPGAALLAFVPKVAGFMAMARLIGLIQPLSLPTETASAAVLEHQLPLLLWILAAVTMTIGNILALLQDNIKRLLAYSSVAHAGYMLIALAAPRVAGNGTIGGTEAIVFYLMSYGLMTLGAFAVLTWLSTPDRPVEQIDDLSGVGRSHPLTGIAMVVFLFSLIGIPLTAGFMGKFLIFLGALQMNASSPQYWLYATLVVIGAINAAIGGYYYLRIIGVLYLRDAIKPLPTRKPAPVVLTIAVCAILTLVGGVYPNPVVQALRKAANGPVAGVAQAEPQAPALAQREP